VICVGLTLLQVIGEEPVTVDRARKWARIADDDDTETVTRLIKSCRAIVENIAWRQIVKARYCQSFDCFAANMRLYRPPLLSATVQYLGTDGVRHTLDAARYVVDIDSEPGRLTPAYGYCWPSTLKQANAVRVEFEAGYASPSAVPEDLVQAILDVLSLKYRGLEIPKQIENQIAVHRHGAIEVVGS